MLFLETPVFTRQVLQYFGDEGYRNFQLALILRPELGALIKGSGGLRKVRWAIAGKGKRGGLRIIYYWNQRRSTVYCLFAYKKGKLDDLTRAQIQFLSRVVEKEFQ